MIMLKNIMKIEMDTLANKHGIKEFVIENQSNFIMSNLMLFNSRVTILRKLGGALDSYSFFLIRRSAV